MDDRMAKTYRISEYLKFSIYSGLVFLLLLLIYNLYNTEFLAYFGQKISFDLINNFFVYSIIILIIIRYVLLKKKTNYILWIIILLSTIYITNVALKPKYFSTNELIINIFSNQTITESELSLNDEIHAHDKFLFYEGKLIFNKTKNFDNILINATYNGEYFEVEQFDKADNYFQIYDTAYSYEDCLTYPGFCSSVSYPVKINYLIFLNNKKINIPKEHKVFTDIQKLECTSTCFNSYYEINDFIKQYIGEDYPDKYFFLKEYRIHKHSDDFLLINLQRDPGILDRFLLPILASIMAVFIVEIFFIRKSKGNIKHFNYDYIINALILVFFILYGFFYWAKGLFLLLLIVLTLGFFHKINNLNKYISLYLGLFGLAIFIFGSHIFFFECIRMRSIEMCGFNSNGHSKYAFWASLYLLFICVTSVIASIYTKKKEKNSITMKKILKKYSKRLKQIIIKNAKKSEQK